MTKNLRRVIKLDGRTYEVRSYGDQTLVYVQTAKGWKTLNGYGRAYRPQIIAKVLAAVRAEQERNQITADAFNDSGVFKPFTCIGG